MNRRAFLRSVLLGAAAATLPLAVLPAGHSEPALAPDAEDDVIGAGTAISSIRLPDGTTIELSDWIDRSTYSTVELWTK